MEGEWVEAWGAGLDQATQPRAEELAGVCAWGGGVPEGQKPKGKADEGAGGWG